MLLPFLAFAFAIGVDFSRVFYYSMTVQNAACRGALYGCLDTAHSTDTAGITQAALADTSNLTPTPTVSTTTDTDADGNPQVSVSVAYTFNTIMNFPVVPSKVDLSRKVSMRILPD